MSGEDPERRELMLRAILYRSQVAVPLVYKGVQVAKWYDLPPTRLPCFRGDLYTT
jgi:hypothetical protein